jgi:hypothetical protein
VVDRSSVSRAVRRFAVVVGSVASALLIVALVLYSTTFYSKAARFGIDQATISPIAAYVPKGSCVLYTEVAFGVVANRLQASNPDCPSVVDPGGLWLAWGYQLVPPALAFVAQWKTYFEHARYVVSLDPMSGPKSTYLDTWRTSVIPWDGALLTWFANHYSLIYGRGGLYIYSNKES